MKALNPGDFTRTDVETNKQFILTETSSLVTYSQASKETGSFYTGSSSIFNGYYKGPLYGSIKSQFYIDVYRTETTQSLGNSCGLLQISQNAFDRKIKEGSVILQSGSVKFFDDNNGNLYLSGSQNTKIGNVFYEFGTIIITDTGSYQNVGSGSFQLTFRATHIKTQLDFSATILPNEYNYSTNPTARINGKTVLNRPRYSYNISEVSSSYGETITSQSIIPEFFGLDPSGSFDERLSPYVTTIGYYNDVGELLAIAKLASPTPKPKDFPITFKSRIDI